MTDPQGVREEPLPDDERAAIATLVPTGYALAGRDPGDTDWEGLGASFEATIAAMAASPPDNANQAAIAVGAAVGDAVRRITDWEWTRLVRDGAPALAVASDDRSLCVQPIDVVLDRLVDGPDGRLAGLLVALAEGLGFAADPGEYRPLP